MRGVQICPAKQKEEKPSTLLNSVFTKEFRRVSAIRNRINKGLAETHADFNSRVSALDAYTMRVSSNATFSLLQAQFGVS